VYFSEGGWLLAVQVVVREAGIERLRIDPGAEIGLEP
jgi:hypothetical protein